MNEEFDLAVVGAGTAGLPAAMAAAARGLKVVVLEKSGRVGGTLHYSSGQMSAAGTQLQRARGIEDNPDLHYADVMRISRGLANRPLVRRAVDLAPGTIDWLMEIGFEMHPSCPAILHLHEAYAIARTYWGVDGGRSILKAIAPVFDAARARHGIDLRLGTATTQLLPGEGLLVRRADGTEARIRARATILATGGYGANPAMFARLHAGMPLYTTASPTSDGSGHAMAQELGATLRNMHFWKPALAGIEDPAGSGRVTWEDVPALTPQVRQPWEIFVDAGGRRFVAEDHESVDIREAALARLPGSPSGSSSTRASCARRRRSCRASIARGSSRPSPAIRISSARRASRRSARARASTQMACARRSRPTMPPPPRAVATNSAASTCHVRYADRPLSLFAASAWSCARPAAWRWTTGCACSTPAALRSRGSMPPARSSAAARCRAMAMSAA